jgi:glutamine synthetase
MTPEQAKKFIEDNDVKYVLAQFVDIHGAAKTKSVPASHLMDVVEDGAGFAGFAAWGLGQEPHSPDFMAKGDLNTLSLVPWQPGYARIVCTGFVNEQPHPWDSRYVLQRVLKRIEAKGWTLNVGIEPEMQLVRRTEAGKIVVADDTDTLEKPCYDYKGLSRSRAFLERLVESLQAVDFDVYQIDHEDANGQFEINYTYSDALEAADRHVFVRMAAGEIAHDMGLICTFMPKSDSFRTGNGMHMHLSVTDKDGKNLFHDDDDKNGMGLSALGYQFAGGLIKHAKGLCALGAPTVNSYKRLVVGDALSGATWAPAYISFGDNNRSSMLRVPYGRLELRTADGGCNPYLAIAGALAAGLDGIDNDLDPGVIANFNHYTKSPQELADLGIGMLPQSLAEAVNELEADTLFADVMGEEIIGEFTKLKRMEWVEYMRHVSDWEIERYLEFF